MRLSRRGPAGKGEDTTLPQPREKPVECPPVGPHMEKGVTEETRLRYNGHESVSDGPSVKERLGISS